MGPEGPSWRAQVVDTDAEGRLCLADSLVYAESLGVEAVVDVATLTGATLTALGEGIGGLYSPNERLAQTVTEAAQDAGVCSLRFSKSLCRYLSLCAGFS